MKRLQALVAATLITGVIGLCMLAIGVNAALNTNTVPVTNAPGDPASAVSAAAPSANAQAQIAQLQNLIAQYQNREKQYQAREQQYQTQLNQANAQLQQYQSLLRQMQQLGIIRINSDGSIQLRVRTFGDGG